MNIGGNVTCYLKQRVDTKNEIGENIQVLKDYMMLYGWLDFISETTNRAKFNAKIEESTHVFLCDYVKVDKTIRELVFVDQRGNEYDITMIDNPMNLNYHLEMFLKFVGD